MISFSKRPPTPLSAARKAVSQSILVLLLISAATLAVSLVTLGIILLITLAQQSAVNDQLLDLLLGTFPTICGIGAAVLLARRIIGISFTDLFKKPAGSLAVIPVGMGLCMAINLATSFLSNLMVLWLEHWQGISITPPDFSYSPDAPVSSGMLAMYACLIAPLLEELLFRGFLLRRLQPLGKGFAIFFSALLFALYHFDLTQLLPAFGVGCLFSYLALQCGSIIPTIIIHMGNNLISVLLSTCSDLFPPAVPVIGIALYLFAALSLPAAVLLYHFDLKKRQLSSSHLPLSRRQRWKAVATSPLWWVFLLYYFFQIIWTL